MFALTIPGAWSISRCFLTFPEESDAQLSQRSRGSASHRNQEIDIAGILFNAVMENKIEHQKSKHDVMTLAKKINGMFSRTK